MAAVRQALPLDAEGIGDVHAESWRVGYEGLFPPETLEAAVERRRRMWGGGTAELGVTNGTLLVAQESGRITGFIHFGPSSSEERVGEVYGFYVHPTWWGTATAPALMERAVALLADPFTRAILWTHANAGRARRFYAKSGWSETGAGRDETLWDGLAYPAVEYERGLGVPD